MSHRPTSMYNYNTSHFSSHPQSSALQTRINQKRAELENLKQLRDLSAQFASQMGTLEAKLATLRDGTEAVAEVLRNWSGVLGVLGMVGQKLPRPKEEEGETEAEAEGQLPPTLVRIPVQRSGEDESEGTG